MSEYMFVLKYFIDTLCLMKENELSPPASAHVLPASKIMTDVYSKHLKNTRLHIPHSESGLNRAKRQQRKPLAYFSINYLLDSTENGANGYNVTGLSRSLACSM